MVEAVAGSARGARPHPLVIAHRGSSDALAEHTLAAYQQAIDEGADALECDARLTADGVLVCVHDRRIDRTSDGRGVVSAKTYNELSQRDYGSWKQDWPTDLDDEDPLPDPPLRGLLTVETLLELIVAAPRPVGLALETKHPVRYGGLVEDRVVAMLKRFGLAETADVGVADRGPQVRVMSFSQLALRRMRTLAPTVPTVLLMDRVPIRARAGYLPGGARIAGPGMHIIREYPGYVTKVHAAGAAVHVWTVDEPADVDLCIELGVDAMITNRPAAVLRRLGL